MFVCEKIDTVNFGFFQNLDLKTLEFQHEEIWQSWFLYI